MKRFVTILLALVMILSLATTAFAATTSGSVVNDTNRSYKAYQIFSGTQAESSKVLGEIVWGNGINAEAFLAALKTADAKFNDCSTAAAVAEKLKTEENNSSTAKTFANIAAMHLTNTATDVAANATVTLNSGYYLLVDQSTPVGGTAKNPALLQVTNGSLKITDKSDAPELEKKVGNADSADVNIGDIVTFTLTATMPTTFDGYETYKVVFHDTMDEGLTYNNDATVSLAGFAINAKVNDDGTTTLTIENENVLDDNVKVGDNITVTYTATLNSNAVINATGNSNTAKLEYSNDPNWDGTGTVPTGNTPEDEVKVYTWDMAILKYADNDEKNLLPGVKFILLNQEKNKIAKVSDGKIVCWDTFTEGMAVTDYELTTGENGKISVSGLKSGTYYLRETQALPGYNKLTADIEIKVEGKTEGYQTAIAKINNNSGATLPETGGVGTTMFYIVGGLMMLMAVVLLVTKKRMADAE